MELFDKYKLIEKKGKSGIGTYYGLKGLTKDSKRNKNETSANENQWIKKC